MNREGQPEQVAESDRLHWYAVYTRSRSEQVVELYLKRLGFTTYLPLHRVWSRRKDRRKQILVSALPGYLFIQTELTAERVTQIKKSPNVVRIVDAAGVPSIIPDSEITSLRLALESKQEVELKPYFSVGDQVRVTRGKMEGAVGCLVRISADELRLVVSVSTVNLVVAVRIDAVDVDHAAI